MKLTFKGPGGPAWQAYDKALEAYVIGKKGPRGGLDYTTQMGHQYKNYRTAMIAHLRKEGLPKETIQTWLDCLEEDKAYELKLSNS